MSFNKICGYIIHSKNKDKVGKDGPLDFLVLRTEEHGEEHDGYCSDAGDFTEYCEEIIELKIPVLLLSPDFINKYFDDGKYIGNVDDINNYLINIIKIGICSKRIKAFSSMLSSVSQPHEPRRCSGWCGARGVTRLISMNVERRQVSFS